MTDSGDSYSALAPYYDLFVNWDKRLAVEIPFILENVPEPTASASCLDLGCGTGRHLERLASAGFKIEGCEPSVHLRKQVSTNLPGTTVYDTGMENLLELAQKTGPWDLVICLGNTLPHLPPICRDHFFNGLKLALKPGGVGVLHILNYNRILKDRPDSLPEKTADKDGKHYVFVREYVYAEDTIKFVLKVIVDGREIAKQSEVLYPITAEDIMGFCGKAGLKNVKLYGSFNNKAPFSQSSNDLVCVIRHI